MIDKSLYPFVSIVVPVYNVEKYIERCVNSLLAQDYKNIEIILVDDGTPDNAGGIIDSFSEKDKRIRVIHKENGGVSSARNAGMNIAAGDYIMFVDGDDWVEPDYVSYFISLIMQNDVSVGMGTDYFTWKRKEVHTEASRVITSEKATESIYNDTIFVAVWNKIYKTSLLRDIKFSTDIWYGEGMLFNIEVLQCVDRVVVGNKMVYHQTFNPKSAMRSFSLESNYCGIASLWLQRSKWEMNNEQVLEEWKYHRYRFNRTIIDGLVRTGSVDKNREVYKECVKNIRRDIMLPMLHEKSAKQKIIWLAYYISPMTISKIMSRRFKDIVNKFGGGITKSYILHIGTPSTLIGGALN